MGLLDGWVRQPKETYRSDTTEWLFMEPLLHPAQNKRYIPECYRIINRIIEFQLVYIETGLKWSYGEEGEEVVLVVEFK